MKYSKTTFIGLGVLLMAVTLIVVNFLPQNKPDESSSSVRLEKTHADKSSRNLKPSHKSDSTASSNRVREKVPAADPAVVAAEREASIEEMQDASTSYDPKELPIIQPYLESADPLLREAAVDAMIVLGDASAGPMLRAAAQKMDSKEESKKMMEAADYVELPPASFKQISEMMKKRKKENREANGSQ